MLYRVARSITRNPTDAEDLVQDTLLRSYRAIDRFDGRHPRAWLLTIMRNAQINRVRRKRPELLRDPDTTMERLADEQTDDLDPSALVVESGFDAAVERARAGQGPTLLECKTYRQRGHSRPHTHAVVCRRRRRDPAAAGDGRHWRRP